MRLHPFIPILRYLVRAVASLLIVYLFFEGTVRMLGLNWRILQRRPDALGGNHVPEGHDREMGQGRFWNDKV